MTQVHRYFAPLWQARSWREYAYLLLGLPFGVLWAAYALTMYTAGVVLVVVWIGLVILVLMQVSLRPIGEVERHLINGLLGERVSTPEPRRVQLHARGEDPSSRQWAKWLHALVHDVHSWSVLGWIMGRLVTGPLGFVVALAAIVMPFVLIAAVALAAAVQLGLVPEPDGEPHVVAIVHTVAFWVLVGTPVIVAMLPMFSWVSRAFTYFHRAMAHKALGLCRADVTAEANARAQLAEEQIRIDQELHDSIGHMITMNVVQAGAGAYVFDTDPEFARQALSNIEERGRAAMGELDRIVATIRGDEPEARAPLPGLVEIDRLVVTARAAGIDVAASIEAADVPAALGRTAFGIVREALTNVGKHAPGARVDVTVARDGDALGIAVINAASPRPDDALGADARAAGQGASRHGVSGIRDRVALLGGHSDISPRPDGGYAVIALLPFGASLAREGDAGRPWEPLRQGARV